MRDRKSIYSTITLFTLLLIPSTLSIVFGTTTTFAKIENIRVYLVISISIRVNIVYK